MFIVIQCSTEEQKQTGNYHCLTNDPKCKIGAPMTTCTDKGDTKWAPRRRFRTPFLDDTAKAAWKGDIDSVEGKDMAVLRMRAAR